MSITPNVTTYCTSETANVKRGGTKKKSNNSDVQHRREHRRPPPEPQARDRRRRAGRPSRGSTSSKYGYIAHASAVQRDRDARGPRVAFRPRRPAWSRARSRALRLGRACRALVAPARSSRRRSRARAARAPSPSSGAAARAGRGASARRRARASPCACCAYSAKRRAGGRAVERHGLGAERLGEPQQVDPPVALLLRQPLQPRRLDVDDGPIGGERVGHALARAHELLGLRVRADRDEQLLAREPLARRAVARERCARRGLDAARRPAQRELAQRDQVRQAEEPVDRARAPRPARRPCRPSDARAGRRAAGRSARPRRPGRRRGRAPSRAAARR